MNQKGYQGYAVKQLVQLCMNYEPKELPRLRLSNLCNCVWTMNQKSYQGYALATYPIVYELWTKRVTKVTP
jgi:hypothetical protein